MTKNKSLLRVKGGGVLKTKGSQPLLNEARTGPGVADEAGIHNALPTTTPKGRPPKATVVQKGPGPGNPQLTGPALVPGKRKANGLPKPIAGSEVLHIGQLTDTRGLAKLPPKAFQKIKEPVVLKDGQTSGPKAKVNGLSKTGKRLGRPPLLKKPNSETPDTSPLENGPQIKKLKFPLGSLGAKLGSKDSVKTLKPQGTSVSSGSGVAVKGKPGKLNKKIKIGRPAAAAAVSPSAAAGGAAAGAVATKISKATLSTQQAAAEHTYHAKKLKLTARPGSQGLTQDKVPLKLREPGQNGVLGASGRPDVHDGQENSVAQVANKEVSPSTEPQKPLKLKLKKAKLSFGEPGEEQVAEPPPPVVSRDEQLKQIIKMALAPKKRGVKAAATEAKRGAGLRLGQVPSAEEPRIAGTEADEALEDMETASADDGFNLQALLQGMTRGKSQLRKPKAASQKKETSRITPSNSRAILSVAELSPPAPTPKGRPPKARGLHDAAAGGERSAGPTSVAKKRRVTAVPKLTGTEQETGAAPSIDQPTGKGAARDVQKEPEAQKQKGSQPLGRKSKLLMDHATEMQMMAERQAAKRARELERRAARKRAELRSKRRAERAADIARGDAPPAVASFRVDPDLVPSVLVVWDMLQTFGALLQLPPFTLATFEAAIQSYPLRVRPSGDHPPGYAAPLSDVESSDGEKDEDERAPKRVSRSPSPKPAKISGTEEKSIQSQHEAPSASGPAGSEGATKIDTISNVTSTMKGIRLKVKLHGVTLNSQTTDAAPRDISAEALSSEAPKAEAPQHHLGSQAHASEAPRLLSSEATTPLRLWPPLPSALSLSPLPDTGPQYQRDNMVDQEASCSALLLRDIHAALVRVIDGIASKEGTQPLSAELVSEDSKAEKWMERVANTISSSSLDLVSPEARAAADELRWRDYACTSPRTRLTLLTCLVDLAMFSDVLRDHVTSVVDAMAGIRARTGPEDAGISRTQTYGGLEEFKSAQATLAVTEKDSVENWLKWMAACRLGIQRPLGADMRGRRYWVLGGRGGAWRVFVETQEGREWGWYEAESAVALQRWLRAGGLEAEGPLLRALTAMPTLQKTVTQPSTPPPSLITSSELVDAPQPAQEEAAPMLAYLSPEEIDRKRPNGYLGHFMPLLRGETHTLPQTGPAASTTPIMAGRMSSLEDRICAALEALISDVDLWMRGTPWLRNVAGLLEAARMTRSGPEIARVVLDLETLLREAGVMSPDWCGPVVEAWRRSLAPRPVWPGVSAREVALHLTALSSCIVSPNNGATRAAFLKVVSAAKCPLYFPAIHDSVVVLRSGCLHHLDKLCRGAGTKAVDLSLPPDAGLAALEACRTRVRELPPVTRYRVAALAYRRAPAVTAEASSFAAAPAGELPEADGEAESAGEEAPKTEGQEQGKEVEQLAAGRPAVMWMLLQPSRTGPRHERGAEELVLPIHVDPSLPDYVVRADVFDVRRLKAWKKGERFRMLFGTKFAGRLSGTYYRGTIVDAGDAAPGGDPWESITVEWDYDGGTTQTKVSPWELEVDPEEAKKAAEEARRADEAAARAARIMAKERLRQMQDEDSDESTLEPEPGPSGPVGRGLVYNSGVAPASPAAVKSTASTSIGAAAWPDSGPQPRAPSGAGVGAHPGDLIRQQLQQHQLLQMQLQQQMAAAARATADSLVRGVNPNTSSSQARSDHATPTTTAPTITLHSQAAVRPPITVSTQSYPAPTSLSTPELPSHQRPQGLTSGGLGQGPLTLPLSQRTGFLNRLKLSSNTPGGQNTAKSTLHGGFGSSASAQSLSGNLPYLPSIEPGATGVSGLNPPNGYLASLSARASMPRLLAGRPVMGSSVAQASRPRRVPMLSAADREGRTLGEALARMGQEIVGCNVWRFWEDDATWWDATISEFNPRLQQHKLTYQGGQEDESFEWLDMSELLPYEVSITTPSSVRQTVHLPLPAPHLPLPAPHSIPTPAPGSQLRLPLPPEIKLTSNLPLADVGKRESSTPPVGSEPPMTASEGPPSKSDLDPWRVVANVLKTGITPQQLKDIVDAMGSGENSAAAVSAALQGQSSSEMHASDPSPASADIPVHTVPNDLRLICASHEAILADSRPLVPGSNRSLFGVPMIPSTASANLGKTSVTPTLINGE